MPNEDKSNPTPAPAPEANPSRRAALSREQRRLLNTPRSNPAGAAEPTRAPTSQPDPVPKVHPPEKSVASSRVPMASAAPLETQAKASRAIELQQAVIIIGAILFVALAFFFGKNYDRLKYLVRSRAIATPEKVPDRFPTLSAAELVEQALADEQQDHWQLAAEKYMEAKQKDKHYPGLLFRLGKLFSQHGDPASADKAFERSIAFGEEVAESYRLRGLMAARRQDFQASIHYFEEATKAAPLEADNYFFWAETLRTDLQPQPAIARYEDARIRAEGAQDALVCVFKIRLAKMEAAQSAEVESELAKKQAAGPLAVDWLMTAAALKIRQGHPDEASPLIQQARDAKWPGLFISCARDMAFLDAAKRYPELAELLHVEAPETISP